MKNLSEVFLMKDQIIAIIKQFGFTDNVKLYNDALDSQCTENGILSFIVNKSKEVVVDYKNSSYLKAKLTDELKCQVVVQVYQNIQPLYRFDVDQKSASLFNEKEIRKLFGEKEVMFASVKEEDETLQRILLEQANNYLDSSKEKKTTTTIKQSQKHILVGEKQKNPTKPQKKVKLEIAKLSEEKKEQESISDTHIAPG